MPEPGSFARLLTVEGWMFVASEFGPAAARALLIAVGTWVAVILVRSSLRLTASRADVNAQRLVTRIANLIIIGLGLATVLDTFGVPLTTFVTVLGVAGLGISLAMQDVLKSFVAGTFLLFERPFRIGDEISVKDQRGLVEDIAFRTTRLRTTDNVQIIIPNAVVFAEVVANRTNEIKPKPAEPDEVPSDHELQVPEPQPAVVPSMVAPPSVPTSAGTSSPVR